MSTTRVKVLYFIFQIETFSVRGSLTIKTPKIGTAFVTEDDIKDNTSESYIFMKETIQDKV